MDANLEQELARYKQADQARDLALEKLRESERRLAEAHRVAHIGSWERDLRTNEVKWSDELYRVFGFTPDDELHLSYPKFLSFVLPQDVDRIRAAVDQTIRDRSSFDLDYRITRPDGSVRVLNDRGAVILNEQGEPLRLVGTARDVTEVRQADEAKQELIRQKVILQTIFDHIPVMINFIDAAGRVQMINREWERVLGWSLEEAQRRDLVADCYPDPESRARVMEYVLNPPPGWADFKTHVKDGRILDTSWALIVLPDGTRIGFGEDMTERKAAERALGQSEQRLSLAVHAAGLGIFEHDHQTDQVYWSPRLRAIYGIGAEQVASLQAYIEMIHPDDRETIVAAVHQAHASKGAGIFSAEHRLVRADGGMRWVNVCSQTSFGGEGDARRSLRTVGVVADITERKRADEALRDYADRLQALSRRLLEVQEEERRHLARELHDELGQVLVAISLQLRAARGSAGEGARPRLDECAAMLKQAEEQMRNLALELRPAMLDTLGLEPTVRSLAEQHQQRTGCAVQIVSGLTGAALPLEMAIVCFRVVQEAMTNIARHAAAQHVWIELNQSESALEVIVRDDGVGFDVVAARERAAVRGSLGLRGMEERVEILGGILQVESDLQRGARIRACFPLSQTTSLPEVSR